MGKPQEDRREIPGKRKVMIEKLPVRDLAHIDEFAAEDIHEFVRIRYVEGVGKENKQNPQEQKVFGLQRFNEPVDIMEDMFHRLAVITVIYRNYTILDDFFASFTAQTDKEFRVFAVDLTEKPQDYPYPRYASVIKSVNNGYAHGVNMGITAAQKAGYDGFIVINSDVMVSPAFVAETSNALKTHPNSIIGGKVYYAPGFEYHAAKYKKEDLGKVLWYAGGVVDWDNCLTNHRGVDEVDRGQFDTPGETQFVTGCLIAYEAAVAETVGPWNEDYFLYYEDADFCERAKRKGIILRYEPRMVIWHKNAASTGGSGSSVHQSYQRRNRLRFGLLFAPFRTKIHLILNYLRGS